MNWRIYYEQGTFSNQDGDWNDAPPWGVICIVCECDDLFRAVDKDGLLDYLTRMDFNRLKIGREVPNSVYNAILPKARSDPDFSPNRIILEGKDYYLMVMSHDN